MIKILNCKNKNFLKQLTIFLNRRRYGKQTDTKIVHQIIKDVKKNKLKAVLKYEKKFSKNKTIRPSLKKINKSIKSLNPKIKKAIDFAYNRILKFHSRQKFKNVSYSDKFKNKLEYKYVPLNSVGIYVPSNLPSTLLMSAIPAKIAGVKKIILTNPNLNSAVLYVAKKIGIKEIYSMGGAQAIASLAYIQRVNKIIGPGNIYVAKAKREVFGDVGIEGMIAGPSEITVLADKKTNLNEVITSLIAQAEHDVNSQCILITKDKSLINNLNKNIFDSLRKLPRNKIASKSLKDNGLIIYAKNDKQIVDAINEISPEHLEINIVNYKKYLDKIHNAGSICIGKYSPMAVTDYNSGTNHVLPTMGSAKFSSGLSVSEFYKKISHIKLSKKGIEKIGEYATHLAEYEKLDGHAQSIKSRIRRK